MFRNCCYFTGKQWFSSSRRWLRALLFPSLLQKGWLKNPVLLNGMGGDGEEKARYLSLVLIQLPLLLIRADGMGAAFPREEELAAALGRPTWEIFHVEMWCGSPEAKSDLIAPSREKGWDNPWTL